MFFVWWHLPWSLYIERFDDLGFDMTFVEEQAVHNDDTRGATLAERPSTIATRRT